MRNSFLTLRRTKIIIVSLAILITAALIPRIYIQFTENTTILPDEESEVIKSDISQSYFQLPLSFVQNRGQTDPEVKFLSRGDGYTLFLTTTEAVLTLSQTLPVDTKASVSPQSYLDPYTTAESQDIQTTGYAALRMHLIGANPESEVKGPDEQPGKSNYFIGNNPDDWRTDVSHYNQVQYQDIYPGVDLVYYGNQRQLEYDFIVSPGTDPATIRLGFDGEDEISVDDQGNLVIDMGDGEVVLNEPVIYQTTDNGSRQAIPGGYVLSGESQVSFQVGVYDTSKPLVIDPVLVYSTYLGGSSSDYGRSIAVDASGNAYVTGWTNSTDFPTNNAYDVTKDGDRDIFITKFSVSGNTLVYSTYLGGNDDEDWPGIAIDTAGNVYICGYTHSADFPTQNAYQGTLSSSYSDVFVTKLSTSGNSLIYSTFLGGSDSDWSSDIAVDSAGNAYVTGFTMSTNFPTQNPFQATKAASRDSFVTKLSPSGSSLVYSTYLGGNWWDTARDIAVDAAGCAYVTGTTESSDFPTQNPYQENAGNADAFVTKFTASGNALVYSTYLGGDYYDEGYGIAVDAAGCAYVTGWTPSINFPILDPYQETYAGSGDVFVTKFTNSGNALVFSTYIGGSNSDEVKAIAVDGAGNAYITGETYSTDFPIENPYDETASGDSDAFVTKLSPSGNNLVFSSYFGGSADEIAFDIAVDAQGCVYVAGQTVTDTGFPIKDAYQNTYAGNGDAFVFKMSTPHSFASGITYNSAILNGELISLGDHTSVNVSFQWGTVSGSLDQTTANQTMSAPGSFSFALNGLTADTTYYYRDVVSSDTTVYGEELSFTTPGASPIIITIDADNIDFTVATLHGNLDYLGAATSVNASFEWGTTSGDLTQETSFQVMTSIGNFSSDLTGLAPDTTYYFRAKGTTDNITVCGNELSFSTPPMLPPSVETNAGYVISYNTTALNGNLLSLGDYSSVNVSFQWGTVSGLLDQTTANQTMSAPGIFSVVLDDLIHDTTYYFRAVASCNVTVFGEELSFTTLGLSPIVTTVGAECFSSNKATLYGGLPYIGAATSVTVSFEWGTASGNLTEETPYQLLTPADEEFSSELTGLTPETTYYFRAKGVTDNVTVYGSELSFDTIIPIPPSFYTLPAAIITCESVILSGNLTDFGDFDTANVSFEWGTVSGSLDQFTVPEVMSTTGTFNAGIHGLSSLTTYYCRTKVTTADGNTGYGEELSFYTGNYGDANYDGRINVLDMTYIARMILLLEGETISADANQDGEVDVSDMTQIAWSILRLY